VTTAVISKMSPRSGSIFRFSKGMSPIRAGGGCVEPSHDRHADGSRRTGGPFACNGRGLPPRHGLRPRRRLLRSSLPSADSSRLGTGVASVAPFAVRQNARQRAHVGRSAQHQRPHRGGAISIVVVASGLVDTTRPSKACHAYRCVQSTRYAY
jgi:hypothetical protein